MAALFFGGITVIKKIKALLELIKEDPDIIDEKY